MKLIICLSVPDIVISIVGHNVHIVTEEGTAINLTREAAIELLRGLQELEDDGHLTSDEP